jgi:SAM-dependent methyltransferase
MDMGEDGDVFGKVFMALYREEPSVHTTERDDGYINTMDGAMYISTYDQWPEYEREALQEIKGRVLDIGLGAGRHALWVQEQGHEVVGIDISPLAVEVSKLRGVKECYVMDMRKLEFPDGHFDTVLMLGANIGVGGDVPITQKILKDIHRITKPDGIVIGSTRDPVKTDNPEHLAYHQMNRERGKPPGLVTIRLGFQGEYSAWFDFLMLGLEDLKNALKPTNWRVRKTCESAGSDYIAILEKT